MQAKKLSEQMTVRGNPSVGICGISLCSRKFWHLAIQNKKP